MGHLPPVLAARSPAIGGVRAPAAAGARGRWPPTTRTPPRWGWRPAAGPWPWPGVPRRSDLFFSTPTPAYLDKTNATTVHAALGLAPGAGAYDLAARCARRGHPAGGSGRRADGPTLAVVSDLRTGLPGAEERDSGDGAAAFVFGPDGRAWPSWSAAAAAPTSSSTAGGSPERPTRTSWEERFGEEVYVPLARAAFAAALKEPG